MGCGHECVSQRDESLPVGQSQRAWVEEFVLRLLVELLPARDPGRVDLDACFMTRTRTPLVIIRTAR
jgi:hypothetical protein